MFLVKKSFSRWRNAQAYGRSFCNKEVPSCPFLPIKRGYIPHMESGRLDPSPIAQGRVQLSHSAWKWWWNWCCLVSLLPQANFLKLEALVLLPFSRVIIISLFFQCESDYGTGLDHRIGPRGPSTVSNMLLTASTNLKKKKDKDQFSRKLYILYHVVKAHIN